MEASGRTLTEPTPAKSRRGCLFYGCLTATVCLLAIFLAGLLGVHQFRSMLNKYTDTQPMSLPEVSISHAALDQLLRRVEDFRDDLRAGRPASPLVLSADEVNALITHDPELKAVSGKFFVLLQADQLQAQVSLPMEDIGLPRFHGRYLNGTASLRIALQNGILFVSAQQFVVKGQPVPAAYMNVIRRQNLADRANENARASVALNLLESVEIKNGRLIVTPKNNQ